MTFILVYMEKDNIFDIGDEDKWRRRECRFVVANDTNAEAIAYAKSYIQEKREAFPENEYEIAELLRVESVDINEGE